MSRPTRFGPRLEPGGGVTFRLWAPGARRVELMRDEASAMQPNGKGWYELHVAQAGAGTRYAYRIDGEREVPDPASGFQPDDAFGTSETIAHDAYAWQCSDWKGRPWHDAVILEIHVGAFTPAGTFRGVIERMDHIVETGVTAIELMPVADFAGKRNWGYDGVLWFAPDSAYGRPDDLKALVDAAHARGLMVFLDVVYNHFGPAGNFLARYAPAFFTARHRTPWGDAIDYRVPEVRAFAIENALHWLDHYRFDGLRLDAVHAIVEPGSAHILTDLAAAAHEFAAANGRHIHLVLENDNNAARFLKPAGGYRAQWNDDYHHAWHVLLTREGTGYYRDYQNGGEHIARTLAQGFSFQGEASAYHGGQPRGEPSAHLPRADFVNFLQNHDQIGNRPKGERLAALAKPEAIAAALAVLLLQPGPPLMFMGDEWGASTPFPFFCDFKDELAEAIRKGRRQEFAEAYAEHGDEIPDPLSQETRKAAVLDWAELREPAFAARLAITRELLAVRRRHIAPLLPAMTRAGQATFENNVLRACWGAAAKILMLVANLSDEHKPNSVSSWGEPLWGGDPPRELPPWTVYAGLRGA